MLAWADEAERLEEVEPKVAGNGDLEANMAIVRNAIYA